MTAEPIAARPAAAAAHMREQTHEPPARGFSVTPEQARAQGSRASILLGPSTLAVPDLGVRAKVVRRGIRGDGTMRLPHDLCRVGWLDTTAPLGARHGSTLLAGRLTRQDRKGALYLLGNLCPGTAVVTTDSVGDPTDWVVACLHAYSGRAMPDPVFDPVGPRTLTLVACGGTCRLPGGGSTHARGVIAVAVPLDPVPGSGPDGVGHRA